MARIRSIKPELLEDEKTAHLSHLEWRLFVSLLLIADDYGNFRAAPGRVKGAALWAHDDAEVTDALDELHRVGLLVLYEVDGQAYGHVAGWEKHQKVDHPGKPSCPGPEKGTPKPSRDSRESPDDLAPDLDLIGSDLIGLDGIGEECSEPPSAPSEPALLVFPCAGRGSKEFSLTQSMVDAWTGAWPGIDVLLEAKRALVWVNANPTKRKTVQGMPAFLTRWCGRAQDRAGSNGPRGSPLVRPPSTATRDAFASLLSQVKP